MYRMPWFKIIDNYELAKLCIKTINQRKTMKKMYLERFCTQKTIIDQNHITRKLNLLSIIFRPPNLFKTVANSKFVTNGNSSPVKLMKYFHLSEFSKSCLIHVSSASTSEKFPHATLTGSAAKKTFSGKQLTRFFIWKWKWIALDHQFWNVNSDCETQSNSRNNHTVLSIYLYLFFSFYFDAKSNEFIQLRNFVREFAFLYTQTFYRK